MHDRIIRVGVIGASLDGTWGGIAHLPALQGLPGFKIMAVGTTRQESADQAAEKFGVPHAYTDPYELVSNPDVDLVTITVRVPEHEKLVSLAIAAGKHVYCEFPLGRTTAEAAGMLLAAEEKGIRHFVGLQARVNPELAYVKDLLEEGYVGRVRAVNVNYSLPTYPSRSKQIKRSRSYMLNVANGANNLTITAGHLMDGLLYLFGPLSQVSGILETEVREVKIEETGEVVQVTAPDHVVVNGRLEGGAILSSQVRNSYAGRFVMEINGTEGDLILESKNSFMFQIDSFLVKGTKGNGARYEELEISAHYDRLAGLVKAGPTFNVAQMYEAIRDDLMNNDRRAPDFRSALSVHELLDRIRTSASLGTRPQT